MKVLFKDMAIYGLGDLIAKAAAFITIPVYTRTFSADEYGTWSIVNTVVALLGSVLILGGDSAYARYYFEAKTLKDRQRVTSTLFFFLAIWSSLVVLGFFFCSDLASIWTFGTNKHALLYRVSILATPVVLINTMCSQALRNQFKARLFTALNILSTALTVGLSLAGILVFNLGLLGLMGGTLLAALLMLPIRIFAVRELFQWTFCRQTLFELLSYGIPLLPVSLAHWVFAGSDRLIIGKLSTLEQVGLYSVAASATSLLGFINSAIGQAWSPHAIRMYEEDETSAAKMIGTMMTYLLAVFGILCVIGTTFSHEGLMLLSSPEYYPAALAVGPLALGYMAYASIQITAMGISLKKRTSFFAPLAWLSGFINIGLNLLLVPHWGMVASSWATACSYLFLTLAYMLVSQKLWPIVYEKNRIAPILFLTFGFTVFAPAMPSFGLLFDIILKAAYCCAYIVLLFVFRGLDERELNGVRVVLQKLWPRKTGDAV